LLVSIPPLVALAFDDFPKVVAAQSQTPRRNARLGVAFDVWRAIFLVAVVPFLAVLDSFPNLVATVLVVGLVPCRVESIRD
jgi:hypothetical protein